jgi:hypothetical protein
VLEGQAGDLLKNVCCCESGNRADGGRRPNALLLLQATIGARQSALTCFQALHSHERQHEALGTELPAELRGFLPSPMPEKLPGHGCASDMDLGSVRVDGAIQWVGKRLSVGRRSRARARASGGCAAALTTHTGPYLPVAWYLIRPRAPSVVAESAPDQALPVQEDPRLRGVPDPFVGAIRLWCRAPLPSGSESGDHGRMAMNVLGLWFCVAATTCAFAQSDSFKPATRDLGSEVKQLFEKRCVECHGSAVDPKKKSFKRFGAVEHLDKVRSNSKFVDSKNPMDSALLGHVVGPNADMPQNKDGEYVELPAEEQAILREWFAANMPLPGEKQSVLNAPAVRPEFVGADEWLDAIVADLEQLAKEGKDPRQARYFTLGHLHNAGAGDERIDTFRRGLTKLLNSLSWHPEPCQPSFFGPGKAIARVLLCDLKWDSAKWERVLKVENNYFLMQGLDQEAEISRRTGTRLAWVRADWFVFHAAQPPLYHDLLAPADQPDAIASDRALESYLGLDALSNIASNNVARAGFVGGKVDRVRGSGVSDNNRLIERHVLAGNGRYAPTGWSGYYWKSYDFGGNAGTKSIFGHPFGPKGVPYKGAWPQGQEFEQDGGEIIWSLPNGMQAYLLVDGKGARIDKGPPDIVKDAAESGGLGSVIVNGISCMACHDQGTKDKQDQMRAHVENLAPPYGTTFTPSAKQAIQRLHPKPEDFAKLLQQDRTRYQSAAQRLGVAALDRNQREPVVAAFAAFRDEKVTFEDAAFELGLLPEVLSKVLGASLGSLRQQLESVESGGNGGVPRDQFVQSFRQIAEQLGIGVIGQGKDGSEAEVSFDGWLEGRQELRSGLRFADLLWVEFGASRMEKVSGSFRPSSESLRDARRVRDHIGFGKTRNEAIEDAQDSLRSYCSDSIRAEVTSLVSSDFDGGLDLVRLLNGQVRPTYKDQIGKPVERDVSSDMLKCLSQIGSGSRFNKPFPTEVPSIVGRTYTIVHSYIADGMRLSLVGAPTEKHEFGWCVKRVASVRFEADLIVIDGKVLIDSESLDSLVRRSILPVSFGNQLRERFGDFIKPRMLYFR